MVLSLLITFGFCGCMEKSKKAGELEQTEMVGTEELKLPVYDFEHFEPLLSFDDDHVHVINFWATWCKPCVEELPYFERLSQKYEDEDLAMHYVSLDFRDQIAERVVPFVANRELADEVLVLDDPRANDWIPKVNEEWSGAIPATLIYKGEHTWFHEGPLTEQQLQVALNSFFNE